jgi:hypothetical protein
MSDTSQPLTYDHARAAVADCEHRLELARATYADAAFAKANGSPDHALEQAEASVAEAERALRAATVVLAKVREAEAVHAGEAEIAREVREDEAMRDALAHRDKATDKLTKAIAAYVLAYQAFTDADLAVKMLGRPNPRVRSDVLDTKPDYRVSQELARVTADGLMPPGASTKARLFGNPAELPSLADAITDESDVIRGGLRHAE